MPSKRYADESEARRRYQIGVHSRRKKISTQRFAQHAAQGGGDDPTYRNI
jgi:hypothetical protein